MGTPRTFPVLRHAALVWLAGAILGLACGPMLRQLGPSDSASQAELARFLLVVAVCGGAILVGPWLLFMKLASWIDGPVEEPTPQWGDEPRRPRRRIGRAVGEILTVEAVSVLALALMLAGMAGPLVVARSDDVSDLGLLAGLAIPCLLPLGLALLFAIFDWFACRRYRRIAARLVSRFFALLLVGMGAVTLLAENFVAAFLAKLPFWRALSKSGAKSAAVQDALTTALASAGVIVCCALMVALGLLLLLASFEPWRKDDLAYG